MIRLLQETKNGGLEFLKKSNVTLLKKGYFQLLYYATKIIFEQLKMYRKYHYYYAFLMLYYHILKKLQRFDPLNLSLT